MTDPTTKALPEDEVVDPDAGLGEPADLDAADGDDPPAELTPTPAAFAQVAQLSSDLVAAIDAALARSEHPEGKARLQEFRDLIADEAAVVLDDGRAMFPDAGLDAPADPPADAPMDKGFKLPKTAAGALLCKGFPQGPPLRFRLADLRPDPPAALTKADEARLARLNADADRLARRNARRR